MPQALPLYPSNPSPNPNPDPQLTHPTSHAPKVKWTDIDGNLYNDAVWLKPPFD